MFVVAVTPSKAIVIFWGWHFSLFEFPFLQTDSPDFRVDKTVIASPGYRQPAEAAVSVCFEPHQLGEVKGLLTLSSDIGGQYTFVLRGTCIPPQAQGPFIFKSGRSLNIPFKNVFLETTTFSYQVKKRAIQFELSTSSKYYISFFVYHVYCYGNITFGMWPVLVRRLMGSGRMTIHYLGDLLKQFSSTSRWTTLALLLRDSILLLTPKRQKTSQCPLRYLLTILPDHGLARWPSPARAMTLFRFSGTIICRVLGLSRHRESDKVMLCTKAVFQHGRRQLDELFSFACFI